MRRVRDADPIAEVSPVQTLARAMLALEGREPIGALHDRGFAVGAVRVVERAKHLEDGPAW